LRYILAKDLIPLLERKPNRKISENIVHYWFVMYGQNSSVQDPIPEQPPTNS